VWPQQSFDNFSQAQPPSTALPLRISCPSFAVFIVVPMDALSFDLRLL
jgi:hypothetical protein